MRLKKYYMLCYPCDRLTYKDGTTKTGLYYDRLLVTPIIIKNLENYYKTGVVFGLEKHYPDCYTLIKKERFLKILEIYTDELQAKTNLALLQQLKESCGYIPYTECITLFEKAFKE